MTHLYHHNINIYYVLSIDFEAVERNSTSIVKRDTGLTPDQFYDLYNSIPSLRNVIQDYTKSVNVLYIYLMKMRTGLPNEDIGSAFNLSKITIGRHIQVARNALEKDFMVKYVNFLPTREYLLRESTTMCDTLFSEDKVVLICDGTYIYVNKSRNYEFQKLTYTDQKKRNFVKVMMYVTANGTIVYAMTISCKR